MGHHHMNKRRSQWMSKIIWFVFGLSFGMILYKRYTCANIANTVLWRKGVA